MPGKLESLSHSQPTRLPVSYSELCNSIDSMLPTESIVAEKRRGEDEPWMRTTSFTSKLYL